MTANSPKATVPQESQNGSPKNFHNSNPTINPLNRTGKIQAIARCLQNITHKQVSNVANVPNPTSTKPIDEVRFAIAHPKTKPIA